MPKKIIILPVLLILILGGCTAPAQQTNWQEKDGFFSGEYQISYDLEKIEVAVGGRKYETSMNAIQSGEAKVGEVALPANVAEKLNQELDKNFKFKITGPVNITAINLASNLERKGLFLPNKNSFVFGELESVDPAKKDCGAIGGTLVSGDFATNGIENGKTTVGFIAACKPVIIGARATVNWTAVKK